MIISKTACPNLLRRGHEISGKFIEFDDFSKISECVWVPLKPESWIIRHRQGWWYLSLDMSDWTMDMKVNATGRGGSMLGMSG